MADYSANHIIDMVMVLGESQNNYRAAARLYAERFPLRRHPSHVTIRALTIRARGGHLNRQRRRHEYDENNARVLTVLAAVHLDRQISSRTIEREIGIPRSTALRILRNLRYHAYHITLVQELRPNHIQMRIEFCHWALARIQQHPDFFRYVLFSDEAKFCSDGQLNRHNCHYWSDENPHWYRAVDPQNRWSVTVWCGIINGYLVGPYFFEGNVNRNSYLELLRDRLPGLLENVDLATRLIMWWQQDGAGPHFALIVRQFLNNHFNARWIGRGGPVNWPPRSPDLTSPDFYLWGYIKNAVFSQQPTTRADMENRIRQACEAIPRETLLRIVRNFHRRLNLCLEANGGNFEHLLRG